ncbi:MAG: beta-N-acetylhexosaminidase [Gammaproteobacteria bacterium]|nr:beta-N-acetylhexosaminidase [Gammaproteobacteria bacterium]
MSLGPIMLDLRGLQLEPDERELLRHPLVGGVILFSRNYSDIDQLRKLTGDIHQLRNPALLIAVDHEGGRVQRFHQGFTRLPACACYGQLYEKDRNLARDQAENAGWLSAVELLSVGIDLSFAPVLDINPGVSEVIGNRAFHSEPEIVAELAMYFCRGMKKAGMEAVGKHFPGHGSVGADSHHAVPIDRRRFQEIAMRDMVPFQRLLTSHLQGIMPAHVIYPDVDEKPAGFSGQWLEQVLRRQLGFQGTIFSDDISMKGAEVLGSYTERACAAIAAGCDMVLVCNNQEAAIKVLETLQAEISPASQVRLIRMHGRRLDSGIEELQKQTDWQLISRQLTSLEKSPELGLADDGIPG